MYSSDANGNVTRQWYNGSTFSPAIQKGAAASAPSAYASSFFANASTYVPGARPNPPTSEDTSTPTPLPSPLFSTPSALNAGIQAISPFAPPIQSTPIDDLQEGIFASMSSPSGSQPSTPGFFQDILNSISGTPSSNPFAASIRQAQAAPAATLQTTAVQTSSTTISVAPSSDKASWNYILQHGNSPWQAIYLDGQQAFRNRSTGQFVKSSRAPSLNGLGAAAPSAGWSFAKVPIFTTMGVGLDVVSIGAAIAIGIYALERFWRK